MMSLMAMRHRQPVPCLIFIDSVVPLILKEFERRIYAGEEPFDENLMKLDLDAAEMFEDWNVESILIFNTECMTNIESVD